MRAYRVDANQKEVVAALRKQGWTVQHLHKVGEGCPDILVGVDKKHNILIEIKDGDGKLTPQQIIWHADWQGQKAVVRTPDEAISAVLKAVVDAKQ